MIKDKVMGVLSLVGMVVMIVGNVLDSSFFWILGDIYVGMIMAIAAYVFLRR